MEARIIKILSGNATVKLNSGETVLATPTGNLKKEIKLLVGDIVNIKKDDYSNNFVITAILPRKNNLIRPTVANVDQLVIVIAPSPAPDFYLVDKLIVYCNMHAINPILVINKIDTTTDKFLLDVINDYSGVVTSIIQTSAVNNQVSNLKEILKNKFTVFAGQSAVGKSSLLNALSPQINQQTNILSKKVDRGKHTTRVCEIFSFDNCLVADTPGFSMLEVLDLEPSDLKEYYADFSQYKCKFSNCCHTNINDANCGVANAVNNNKLSINRYNRYVTIYKKLKESWDKKYD